MQFIKKNKPILIIFLMAMLTTGIIIFLFGADSRIHQENIAYLRRYGWEVAEPAEITRLRVPQELNLVYRTYQEIVGNTGFDFTSYQGKTLTRYSYPVKNHKDSGTGMIRANVLVFRNKIVAADIGSLQRGGFLQAVDDTTGQQK